MSHLFLMLLPKFVQRTPNKFLNLKKLIDQIQFRNLSTIMSKSAVVILAPGAEEMEFTISADVLRRAGVCVTIAGLDGDSAVTCSRDLKILPDTSLECAIQNDYDAVVMPGGLGCAKALAASPVVGKLLKKYETEGRIIAVMCASPIALDSHGICLGKRLTSYPSFKEQLSSKFKYVDNEKVVQDGILITSQGPATAFDFALKIAEVLVGSEKSKEVAKAMLMK